MVSLMINGATFSVITIVSGVKFSTKLLVSAIVSIVIVANGIAKDSKTPTNK